MSWERARSAESMDEFEKLIDRNRLSEDLFVRNQVSSSLLAGGYHHHGDRLNRRVFLLFAAKLPAIHHRHRQVQENHGGSVAGPKVFERRSAILDANRLVAPSLQKLGCDSPYFWVVIDHQHKM